MPLEGSTQGSSHDLPVGDRARKHPLTGNPHDQLHHSIGSSMSEILTRSK